MKHDPKQSKPKVERSESWGLVSSYQRVPLFDKTSTEDHTFANDVYNRRKEEIDSFAERNGFRLVTRSAHMVTFKRKMKSEVNNG